jgi:hypothetical protein
MRVLAAVCDDQHISPWPRPTFTPASSVAAQAGDVVTVRSILDSFLERSEREWISPLMIAQAHQALGDNDAAFHWYDRAYQVRDNLLTVLHTDRSWQLSPPGAPPITSDPRWESLIRRIGVAP